MCQGIIYRATNLINGKIYIGKTIQKLRERIRSHIKDAKILKESKKCIENEDENGCYFHNALNKYGKENFKWEIIYECDNELVLNVMETMKIIVNHSHRSENGYNLTWGGDGSSGYKHTKEALRKISETSKGRIKSEETRKKLGDASRGRKHSEETKRKISEAQKGEKGNMYGKHPSEETRKKMCEANKGCKNGFYGKHHTEETRKKIGEANKSRIVREETRKKMSDANKGCKNSMYGKKHTEETKKKMGEAKRGKIISEETRKKMSDAAHKRYD